MQTFNQWLADHPEWELSSDLVVAPPQLWELLEDYPDAKDTEISRHVEDMTSFGATRGAIYMLARRKGQSHRFAEMAAMNRPPRCNTDDVQFRGIPTIAHQQDGNPYMKNILAKAKQRGFVPPAHAIYHSGLARYPGDHEAFVTPEMGRGYIRRLSEFRGSAVEGDMTIPHRPPDYDPLAPERCVPMAEDLIRANSQRMIAKDPALKKLKRKELRERVLQQFGPSK